MIPLMLKKPWSSNVAEAGYDDASMTLFVRYVGGKLYRYEQVPKFVAEPIVEAGKEISVGSLIASTVKGRYIYSEACQECGASLSKPHKCEVMA